MASSSNADTIAKVEADAAAKAKAEADLVRLHPAFPRSPQPCRIVATAFFDCFNQHGVKEQDDDKEAGIRGIKACLKEKKAYDTCLDEYIKKKPIKLIRVQEEYRKKPDS